MENPLYFTKRCLQVIHGENKEDHLRLPSYWDIWDFQEAKMGQNGPKWSKYAKSLVSVQFGVLKALKPHKMVPQSDKWME